MAGETLGEKQVSGLSVNGRHSRVPVNRFLIAWLRYVIPIPILFVLGFGWYEVLFDAG